jgi:hypothetical protein
MCAQLPSQLPAEQIEAVTINVDQDFKTENFLLNYLLGDVSPEDRASFEEQFAADDILFEQLMAAEYDLIDSYVKGRLSVQQKKRFESHFLVLPERKERVEFAKALMHIAPTLENHAEVKKQPPGITWYSRWRPMAAHAASILIIWIGVSAILVLSMAWIVHTNIRLRRRVAELQIQQRSLQDEDRKLREQVQALSSKLASQKSPEDHRPAREIPPSTPAIVTLLLRPGVNRSDSAEHSLLLSRKTSLVRLQLISEQTGYSGYSASLETAEGELVRRIRGIKVRQGAGTGTTVTLEFPARLFKAGDYVLTLFGIRNGQREAINSYIFQVIPS